MLFMCNMYIMYYTLNYIISVTTYNTLAYSAYVFQDMVDKGQLTVAEKTELLSSLDSNLTSVNAELTGAELACLHASICLQTTCTFNTFIS